MSLWYRLLAAGGVLVPVAAVPLVVVLAVRDGVGATLFVAAWVVVLAAVLTQVYFLQPERIVIEGRVVEFAPRLGHRSRRVDASALRAVRWSPGFQHLTVTWEGGRVFMPRYIDGFAELLRDLMALQPDLDVRSTMWIRRERR